MKYGLLLALILSASAIGDEVVTLGAEEVQAIQKDYQAMALEPGAVMFTPPEGWKMANPKVLTPHIKIMVVGELKGNFPPSINLAFDPFKGTLKEYLKLVKSINDSSGAEWKDLGMIRTQAGDAALLQVDSKTKWGVERQMQAIFIKDQTAWILTCSALRTDFPKYYKDFFEAMKSLRINKKKD